jgi:hypothetical protein
VAAPSYARLLLFAAAQTQTQTQTPAVAPGSGSGSGNGGGALSLSLSLSLREYYALWPRRLPPKPWDVAVPSLFQSLQGAKVRVSHAS